MNQFQKAVQATQPREQVSPVTGALMEALDAIPDSCSGLRTARRLVEGFLEEVIHAHFALRDMGHHGGSDEGDIIESSDALLSREYFVFEVLADEPLPDCYSLKEIGHATTEGPFVGSFGPSFSRRAEPSEMAKALYGAGSDPSFFDLYAEED